jgi:acylphosphatase
MSAKPGPQIQRRVIIQGRVQGVGFRASAKRASGAFPKLRGFIRNLPDGSVEAVFAGEQLAVLSMVTWCKSGPPAARIVSVDIQEQALDPSLKPFAIAP